MIAGIASSLAILADLDHTPAGQLLLHQKEDIFRNDGFMVPFHIVLRNRPVILDSLLRQKIRGIGLLKERITDVLLIPEN